MYTFSNKYLNNEVVTLNVKIKTQNKLLISFFYKKKQSSYNNAKKISHQFHQLIEVNNYELILDKFITCILLIFNDNI